MRQPWPLTLSHVTYGGPDDTWGLSWTAGNLQSSSFGVSIQARYTDTAGDDRAHIDSVRVTIFYSAMCD